jgi:hypothetical protein
MKIIPEHEFSKKMLDILTSEQGNFNAGCVTGVGRSGAIAAVYASHMLSIPFIHYGAKIPPHLGRLLIIDTARLSGRTLRKAAKKYAANKPAMLWIYDEPPRVMFWYEILKKLT